MNFNIQKLRPREQIIFDWLQDDLSRQIFLSRKNWTKSLTDKDFTATYTTADFEKFFYGKNDFYRPVSKLMDIAETNKCIVYGYGKTGKSFVSSIRRKENIVAIYDNNLIDAEHPPNSLAKYPVFDYVIVTVIVPNFQRQIVKELLDLGISKDKILCPFMIDEENQYFDSSIVEMAEDEIFIDGGCFDFATSKRLLQLNSNVKKIYAYEPDAVNYEQVKISAEQSGFSNIDIKPLAWYSSETALTWESHGGASRMGGGGTAVVKATTIDNAVQDDVTFIKMDLEGTEMEALKGAKQTIRRCHPKLAISIYHKPEDYFEIAEYIKSLVPEYRAYIRHYSSVNVDTVLYCVI